MRRTHQFGGGSPDALLHIVYLHGKNRGVRVPGRSSGAKIEGFLKVKRCCLKEEGEDLGWRKGPGSGGRSRRSGRCKETIARDLSN